MKLTQKITLALGVLAAAGASFAQTAANRAQGLLGQRYVDVGFGVQDADGIKDNLYTAGATVNLPFVPNAADFGFSYTYSRFKGPVRANGNAIGGNLNLYAPLQGVKPFVGVNVGWQWTSIRGFDDDDYGVWGAAAGVEIPVGAFTITPRIVYADDFENSANSSQDWTYEVEGNYWFSATSAAYASVGKTDGRRGSIDLWNYKVGVRVKF
jgi:hypothetical protein